VSGTGRQAGKSRSQRSTNGRPNRPRLVPLARATRGFGPSRLTILHLARTPGRQLRIECCMSAALRPPGRVLPAVTGAASKGHPGPGPIRARCPSTAAGTTQPQRLRTPARCPWASPASAVARGSTRSARTRRSVPGQPRPRGVHESDFIRKYLPVALTSPVARSPARISECGAALAARDVPIGVPDAAAGAVVRSACSASRRNPVSDPRGRSRPALTCARRARHPSARSK
jgi:hypothetical protein